VKFVVEDIVTHADSIHRGMGQMFPAIRNGLTEALNIYQEGGLIKKEPYFKCRTLVFKEEYESICSSLNEDL
jgi:predicted small metal-binding protein